MKKREIYMGQMDWEALGGERGEWEERDHEIKCYF